MGRGNGQRQLEKHLVAIVAKHVADDGRAMGDGALSRAVLDADGVSVEQFQKAKIGCEFDGTLVWDEAYQGWAPSELPSGYLRRRREEREQARFFNTSMVVEEPEAVQWEVVPDPRPIA